MPPTHDNVDAAVGYPTTVNESPLPVMADPPVDRPTVKDDVALLGAVSENVNVEPPFVVASDNVALPLDNTRFVKSLANPVVVPAPSLTVTVHFSVSPTRTVLLLLDAPTQSRVDAVVGWPTTVNESPLPEMEDPLLRASDKVKDDRAVAGALIANTYVAPPLELVIVGLALPLESVNAPKSVS